MYYELTVSAAACTRPSEAPPRQPRTDRRTQESPLAAEL